MRRNWRVSVLAVLTIAVTLFTGGMFLLLSGNLSRLVGEWRDRARVLVYLEPGLSAEAVEGLRRSILEKPFVGAAEVVSSEEAASRFAAAFPGLSHLLGDLEEPPLPASIEVAYDGDAVGGPALRSWSAELRETPGVAVVDGDRGWLRRLETLVAVVRGVGLVLAGVLLAASVFTIAGVVRLTTHLYREEIVVLRLVGATEFVIHGPFLVGGLLQGLAGSLLALVALRGAYELIAVRALPPLLGSTLFNGFLGPGQLSLLVGVGAAAGLVGAVLARRQ